MSSGFNIIPLKFSEVYKDTDPTLAGCPAIWICPPLCEMCIAVSVFHCYTKLVSTPLSFQRTHIHTRLQMRHSVIQLCVHQHSTNDITCTQMLHSYMRGHIPSALVLAFVASEFYYLYYNMATIE